MENSNLYDTGYLTFRDYLTKVFTSLGLGLAISTVSAFLFISLGIMYTSFGTSLMMVSIFVELGVAFFFGARLTKMSKATAWTCYIMYSIMTGISLSAIISMYSYGSVVFAFGATTILFVCMSIIGHTTKLDLTKFSTLLLAGLISLIVMSLLNSFIFRSARLDYSLMLIGVLIFLGLIAYDVQKLRYYYDLGQYDVQMQEKIMIYGAFGLYLDFINLFIRILEIFGRRKD